MTKTTNDRRYRRTQKQLKTALITLLKTKPIHQISVRELSELADINRATFYLHYKTPNDLLKQLENELFEVIFTYYQKHNRESPEAFFLSLFQSFRDHYNFSQILVNPKCGITFWERISKEVKKECRLLWENEFFELSNREKDYVTTFIVDGYLALVKAWLENGMIETPKEMVEFTIKFDFIRK